MDPMLGYRLEDEDHDWLEQNAVQPAFTSGDDAPEPVEIDPRGVIELMNQLRMGSCAGHAGVHAGSFLNWMQTGGKERVKFSRMFAYLRAQEASGFLGRDQGASITGLVQGMMRYGMALESQFPYPGSYTTRIPAAATTYAASHKIREHVRFKSFEELHRYQAQRLGAIVIGIPWTSGLQNIGPVGEINHIGGQYLGGHALVLAGYSKRKDANGDNYPFLGNSHGPQWANKGWCEIAPTVVRRWIADRNAEVIGINLLNPVLAPKIKIDMDK